MVVAHIADCCNLGFGGCDEVFVNVLQSSFQGIGNLRSFRQNIALMPVTEDSRKKFQYICTYNKLKSGFLGIPFGHYFGNKSLYIYVLQLIAPKNLLT